MKNMIIKHKGVIFKIFSILKYLFILLILCIIILLVSYKCTYITLTPDFREEKFKKYPLGMFEFELPETFSLLEENRVRYSVLFKEYKIYVLEEQYSAQNKDSINQCNYDISSKLIPVNEHILLNVDEHAYQLYIPNNDAKEYGNYELQIIFPNGCMLLKSETVKEHSENALQLFINHVNSLFKYYSWLENDKTINIGFRTLLGIIEQNDEFKLNLRVMFAETNKSIQDKTVVFTVNFITSDTEQILPIYRDFSFFDKIVFYIESRLQYKILMGYGWSLNKVDCNFSSYYCEEIILMKASKNTIPISFDILSHIHHKDIDFKFFSYIEIDVTVFNKENSQPPINYNVLYGYYLKLRQSIFNAK
ncbi:MAG: hypothetical protein LBE38_06295 [Deltaproteobacteria bacterium]|jgi:hypothetical protein|nr:hypothetical protein [Deltaproteobacteria bacterium]